MLLSLMPTSITLAASQSQAVYGQAVDLTATVVASPGAPSEGTVTFKDGRTVLGTVTPSTGTATSEGRRLLGGNHLITASYSDPQGDYACEPHDRSKRVRSLRSRAAGTGPGLDSATAAPPRRRN